MISLPLAECSHRLEELTPGRYRCTHPQGQNGPRGTTAELCAGCRVRPGAATATLHTKHSRKTPCFHLGAVLDRLGCNCSRRWLMACELHGECTLGRTHTSVRSCKDCLDYEPDTP